jgi:hypothetical protein
MTLDVRCRRPQSFRIIAKTAKTLVAIAAQQIPGLTGRVVVILVQTAFGLNSFSLCRVSADHAAALLSFKPSVVLCWSRSSAGKLRLAVIVSNALLLMRIRPAPFVFPALKILRLTPVVLPLPRTRQGFVTLPGTRELIGPVRLEQLTA